jgi:hypothetical protein
MQRDRVLADLNGRILQAYSQRTAQVLRALVPLRLVLPHLEPILALNVEKECRKDALVVQCASQAVAAKAPPDRAAIERLLAAGKSIDRAFLDQIGTLPVRIEIRYQEIVPLRVRRIECLLDVAYRILDSWPSSQGLRAALRASYQPLEFERRLREVLRLYALEARALGHAVRLPLPLRPLRELIAQRLSETMNDVGARLAHDITHGVFRIER